MGFCWFLSFKRGLFLNFGEIRVNFLFSAGILRVLMLVLCCICYIWKILLFAVKQQLRKQIEVLNR